MNTRNSLSVGFPQPIKSPATDHRLNRIRLLRLSCQEVTGEVPQVSCFTGYTDTAVIAGQLHNRNCMSYGPGCLEAAHQPDEWVVIDDILRCEQVYQQLVKSTI